MLTEVCYLALGLLGLGWSADRFVFGATELATHFNVPKLFIGLTIIAMGTSAPELVVSIIAALQGHPSLSVGNVIGSNIANIGLVLGLAAILHPISMEKKIFYREYKALGIITAFACLLMFKGSLTPWDGFLLFAGLAGFIYYVIRKGLLESDEFREKNNKKPHCKKITFAYLWVGVGIILLPLSANLIVESSTSIARALGLSELIIGLTLVALGTSLPEVATTISCAFKKEHGLALGNILGSNIFNLLLVLPFPAIISPFKLSSDILYRDLPVMLGLTLLIFFTLKRQKNAHVTLTRPAGILFIVAYFSYMGGLCWLS